MMQGRVDPSFKTYESRSLGLGPARRSKKSGYEYSRMESSARLAKSLRGLSQVEGIDHGQRSNEPQHSGKDKEDWGDFA